MYSCRSAVSSGLTSRCLGHGSALAQQGDARPGGALYRVFRADTR